MSVFVENGPASFLIISDITSLPVCYVAKLENLMQHLQCCSDSSVALNFLIFQYNVNEVSG